MHLDVLAIDSPLAALAMRSVLEYWGIQVHTFFIGKTEQIVDLLSDPIPRSPWIILECHGIPQGIALPDLAPDLEARQPYHGAITPSDLQAFVHLPSATVINTGCSLGTSEFARVFLGGGAHAYIGAQQDPEGSAALLYVLRLFYGLHCHHLPLEVAHEQARQQVPETMMFELFLRPDDVMNPRE